MNYSLTFACGHEGKVHLTGSRNNKEGMIRWYEECGRCPECKRKAFEKERQKEIEELNNKIEKIKEEFNLPELNGTEKQVAWATSIRFEKIIGIIEKFNKEDNMTNISKKMQDIFVDQIEKIDDARFWIDNRDAENNEILKQMRNRAMCEATKKEEKSKDIPAGSVLKPNNPKKEGAAEVKIEDNNIILMYKKDGDFILLAKSKKFKWNRIKNYWEKSCNEYTGPVKERAADVINTLLFAGFCVICEDEEIREMAINAEFGFEKTKWIKYSAEKNKFFAQWDREKNFYDEIIKIYGAKYDKYEKKVFINVNSYREILDFAEVNDFAISKKATDKFEELKQAEKIVTPILKEKEIKEDKLIKILQSDRNILEDLKDDD